jgi:hypothetical protein
VIRLPGGSLVNVAAGETNFTQTAVPGIYTVTSARGAKKFVVNLDPAESRTAALPFDELERLGVPTSHALGSDAQLLAKQVRLQNAEIENRQKLWRWVIIGTLLVLLLETWLAGRTSRAVSVPTTGAAA